MTVSLTQTVCYSDVPCNLNTGATGKKVYVTACLVLLKALNVNSAGSLFLRPLKHCCLENIMRCLTDEFFNKF